MHHTLVLFDIDGTLLTTLRAGIRAMGVAGRELFGEAFDEARTDYAGRLDSLILHDLLTSHDLPPTGYHFTRFRARYRFHLARLLETERTASACPGVHDLVGALSRDESVTLGLLTGNFPETGAIKLRACGLDPDHFPVQAWGDESFSDPPTRNDLPEVAMRKHHARAGAPIDPARVVVIGDTPHDVACALAHDCRALAVATGRSTVDELRRAGAHLALPDLRNTSEVLRWLRE